MERRGEDGGEKRSGSGWADVREVEMGKVSEACLHMQGPCEGSELGVEQAWWHVGACLHTDKKPCSYLQHDHFTTGADERSAVWSCMPMHAAHES